MKKNTKLPRGTDAIIDLEILLTLEKGPKQKVVLSRDLKKVFVSLLTKVCKGGADVEDYKPVQ